MNNDDNTILKNFASKTLKKNARIKNDNLAMMDIDNIDYNENDKDEDVDNSAPAFASYPFLAVAASSAPIPTVSSKRLSGSSSKKKKVDSSSSSFPLMIPEDHRLRVAAASLSGNRKETTLPDNFVPGIHDVICNRGKQAYNHPGNIAFRESIERAIPKYEQTTTKAQRSAVVSNLVSLVQSMGTGFVKNVQNGSSWIIVSDHLAREKVGQMLRDALSCRYKSSFKSKQVRRKVSQSKLGSQVEHVIQSNEEISKQVTRMAQISARHRKATDDNTLLRLFEESNNQILSTLKSDKSLLKKYEAARDAAAQMKQQAMQYQKGHHRGKQQKDDNNDDIMEDDEDGIMSDKQQDNKKLSR